MVFNMDDSPYNLSGMKAIINATRDGVNAKAGEFVLSKNGKITSIPEKSYEKLCEALLKKPLPATEDTPHQISSVRDPELWLMNLEKAYGHGTYMQVVLEK